jgi:epoxyqueuosine reductase
LRNVAVALGNWGSPEAVPVLSAALSDTEPLVRGHAVWALAEVGTADAMATLDALGSSESDPFVLAELADAFGRLRPNVK